MKIFLKWCQWKNRKNDYKHHYVNQQYLPDELIGNNYIIDEHPVDDSIKRVIQFAEIKTKSDLKLIDEN